MRIYDPQQLPTNNRDLLNYGKNEIKILCEFFIPLKFELCKETQEFFFFFEALKK